MCINIYIYIYIYTYILFSISREIRRTSRRAAPRAGTTTHAVSLGGPIWGVNINVEMRST